MACCFGFNEADIALDTDRDDNSGASPILNLDDPIKIWAYEKMKANYKRTKNCLQPKFPKQKDCTMKVLWSEVYFSKGKVIKDYKAESNGHTETEVDEIDDPNNLSQVHIETFTMKCANSLNDTIETTLTPERAVKSTYEVTVHKGVQAGQTLQLEMQLGKEDVGQVGVEYEFSKILEHYNESKNIEEVETRWTNAYPVKIGKGKVAIAKFHNKYQTFKKKLRIESEFHGIINIELKSNKKVGGKFIKKLVSLEAFHLFQQIMKDEDTKETLKQYLELDSENLRVKYKSVLSVSSNSAVNQDVEITQEDINPE